MPDEFEERERSVGDAVPGDERPSESQNGHARWDPTPRVGTVPADAYSSSSQPYISTLPTVPEPSAPEHVVPIQEPLVGTETHEVAEQPSVVESDRVETTTEIAVPEPAPAPLTVRTPPPPPPPPPPPEDEGDEEEEGMLRMSFMEHLEELRTRILRALMGLVVAFLLSMFFTKELWRVVAEPAVSALNHLGFNPPDNQLVAIKPMEQFNIIWLYMPLLVSVFLASPWILYQVWAFISPGLYKREKRFAVPFILSTAGLFITGGLFAYFVAFRYGLEFLLGIGRDISVRPMVSISEYFDLFVNVTLGVGLVFELPVVIFFLTLLRLASPRFLVRHSRYAILGSVVLAAIVTPTPDVINLMIFAIPMVMLFFVGVFASYLLVLKREGKGIPWKLTSLFA